MYPWVLIFFITLIPLVQSGCYAGCTDCLYNSNPDYCYDCNVRYYGYNYRLYIFWYVISCRPCDPTCYTCSDSTSSSCTGCNSAAYRTLSGSSCVCLARYY